jgi:hypothetical protein
MAIANNTPILTVVRLGASRIVVLPTGIACSLQEPPKGAIARALHGVTLLIAWQVIRDLEQLGDDIHGLPCTNALPARCVALGFLGVALSHEASDGEGTQLARERRLSAGFNRTNLHCTVIITSS